jgi:hypothetical protein
MTGLANSRRLGSVSIITAMAQHIGISVASVERPCRIAGQ